jgi:hypothetical protein
MKSRLRSVVGAYWRPSLIVQLCVGGDIAVVADVSDLAVAPLVQFNL